MTGLIFQEAREMPTDYAIDPELRAWLHTAPVVDLSTLEGIKRVREGYALLTQSPELVPAEHRPAQYQPDQPLDIRDVMVPGPANAPDVRVRIYAPSTNDVLRPGLLYLHGGGFVIGSVEMTDPLAAMYADRLGVVVVSVDYRLAPEHPFPAPLEDCYAALTWLAAKAGDLGVDPDRIGVFGQSAGGGLAAGATLLARDRGGPALCFQYLEIPELDDRLDTPSARDYVDTPLWNRPNAENSWRCYLGEVTPGGPDVSPYAAPARAEDLAGLPPACVTTCQFDPLRDEGLTYAQRLMHAGVPTELRHYPGTFHGSFSATEAAVSKRMLADTLDDLRRGLRA
jgi:acetyl esterase